MNSIGIQSATTRKRQLGSDNLEATTRKRQLGSDNSEATTRKRQLGSDNLEATTRKRQLGSDNSEATAWKRQLGSDNLEATTWKRQLVTLIGFRRYSALHYKHSLYLIVITWVIAIHVFITSRQNPSQPCGGNG